MESECNTFRHSENVLNTSGETSYFSSFHTPVARRLPEHFYDAGVSRGRSLSLQALRALVTANARAGGSYSMQHRIRDGKL